MRIIDNSAEMQAFAWQTRMSGRSIAVVPTMGYLHDGHLSLASIGREKADILIVTVFVNPTQFAAHEDLDVYPLDREGDLAKCEAVGADIVFWPKDARELYPEGYETAVTVQQSSQVLCGVSRPHHFGGVATICAKLFNITLPNVAVFGEKDFQQLSIIRRMAADLNFPVEVIGGPLVRESSGLAMSSRNAYLKPEEMDDALALSRAAFAAQKSASQGERNAARILEIAKEQLATTKRLKVDYLELRRSADLTPITEEIEPGTRIFLAANVGSARLIDNVKLL